VVGVCLLAWILAIFVGGQALLGLTGHNWSPGVFGFLLGGGAACVPWALWTAVTQTDGSWSWRIGAFAERRSAEALARLGPRWRLRYNMVFYDGKIDEKKWISDIDCVATGPSGILAVSTKWTGDRWDLNNPIDEWLLAAAKGAARNAGRLAAPVRQVVKNPPIVPVVICWGPQLEPISGAVRHVSVQGQQFGDVLVLHGAQADEWLPMFDRVILDDPAIEAADNVVADWIATHEARHQRNREARDRASLHLRWSTRLTYISAAVVALATTWWVAALAAVAPRRSLDHFIHLGGGLAAMLYMFIPFALPIASAVVAHRARAKAVTARITAPRIMTRLSVLAGAVWILTVASTFAFT
jgi:hypothetical protein